MELSEDRKENIILFKNGAYRHHFLYLNPVNKMYKIHLYLQ